LRTKHEAKTHATGSYSFTGREPNVGINEFLVKYHPHPRPVDGDMTCYSNGERE